MSVYSAEHHRKKEAITFHSNRLTSSLALIISGLVLASTGPAQPSGGREITSSQRKPSIPDDAPQFATGYETSECSASPANEISWMAFNNTSPLPDASPWAMSVYYENVGDTSDRYARVIDDPTTTEPNKVLHYWLKNATIDTGYQQHTKGRIQSGFPDELVDAVEVYATQRVFIPEDMGLLVEYPPDADPWWIGVIIETLWSGAAWQGHPNASRITLNIYPQGGQLHLELICRSSSDSRVFWDQFNPDYTLPLGEWLTIETGYKMGDATTGRMVVVITEESTGQRHVIFDVTNWTYDPIADDPDGTGPVPLTHWNPQKLYTSDNVVDFIRDSGGVLQVYFDDFAFSDHWPTDWPSQPKPTPPPKIERIRQRAD